MICREFMARPGSTVHSGSLENNRNSCNGSQATASSSGSRQEESVSRGGGAAVLLCHFPAYWPAGTLLKKTEQSEQKITQ